MRPALVLPAESAATGTGVGKGSTSGLPLQPKAVVLIRLYTALIVVFCRSHFTKMKAEASASPLPGSSVQTEVGHPQMAAAPIAWVVVLGDFGRSPRMQYHTLSLSSNGYTVHVLASPGAAPIQELQHKKTVHLHYLHSPPAIFSKLPTVMSLIMKVLCQLLLMLWLMVVRLPRPSAILMQNPPAIPVMLLCWIASIRHGASLIIDWHNFAYTIMQLKYNRYQRLIHLAQWHEAAMGRRARYNFCVTKAMQRFLESELGIHAEVLYDRPPKGFQPATSLDKHQLLTRLQATIISTSIGSCLQQYLPAPPNEGIATTSAAAVQLGPGTSTATISTLLTVQEPGSLPPSARTPRPALVISSTSWTPDEDFGMLLAAAVIYDAAASKPQQQQYPDILFIITGRGPQREMYLNRIKELHLNHVAFCSIWLEPEDYPKVLACADLGVCLHTSSSGLDLPMKVVDMYGAGLPVCAVDYQCIQELVKPGKTGLLFTSPQELAEQLLQLLEGFNSGQEGEGLGGKLLQRLREGVAVSELGWRWEENWQQVALPVFEAACGLPDRRKAA